MTVLVDDYAALRHDVGAVELPRDVVLVHGPDAVSFLQGQLSQDVAALDVGTSADSLLLQPQGKVDAFLRVSRLGEDALALDVEGGWGEAVLARLTRFKLRIKADLEPLEWRCLAVRGPRAHGVADGPDARPADWPSWPGVDLLGPDVTAPAGVRMCSMEAYEAARIETGVPSMGAELDERTIPEEAGIVARAVSFTKGCYTGQELVARIDSRGGNVPRRLRGLVIQGDPPVGAAVVVGGKQVGSLTSLAPSPALGRVALAYVQRAVDPPADALVSWEGGEATALIHTLPLVPA